MKSILAILLSTIYIFSAITPQEDWKELAKISDLISHYQEHSLENPTISFIDFLHLHYGENAAKHHTQHNHDKLPFKNHHHTDITFITASIDLHFFALPTYMGFVGEKYLFPIYNDIESDQRLSDIWQPPKLS